MTATIHINGEPHPHTASTVAELLRERGLDLGARGIAVAVNGAVARRRDWPTTPLAAGDIVDIVKPFGGG